MLTLDMVVIGLELFGNRYNYINVFGQSIDLKKTDGLKEIGEYVFVFERYGQWYQLQVFPDGVASLTKIDGPPVVSVEPTLANIPRFKGVAGEVFPNAFAVLVGEELGPSRRVFCMWYNSGFGAWQAYDGALTRWLKECLVPQSFLKGI